jgi:hypothetical protein
MLFICFFGWLGKESLFVLLLTSAGRSLESRPVLEAEVIHGVSQLETKGVIRVEIGLR